MAITNSRLAGDVIDITSMTKCLFLVDGTTINLSEPYYQLDRLSVSYEGKTLEFSEIATPGISNPSFDPDDLVELKFNFGAGLKTYFNGKIRRRTKEGRNNNESITYVAFGYQNLANEFVLKGPTGVPYLPYYISSDATTVGTLVTWGTPVNSIASSIFTLGNTDLVTLGIPSTIGSPGFDVLEAACQQDITFENRNFVDALNELLGRQPDRKLFFDDPTGTWIFPSVLTSDIVTITINSVNVGEFTYSEDLTDRWTAIEMIAAYEGAIVLPARGTSELTEDWNGALETDWCLQKVGGGAASEIDPAYLPVFRRYKISGDLADANPRAPMGVYAAVSYYGEIKYIPIDAQIDLASKVVVTNVPMVLHGNLYDKNEEKIKPAAMFLGYWDLKSMPTEGWPTIRVPTAGFEGTAYTLYGLERLKTQYVDMTELSTFNATVRLSVLKDVIVSGSLEIEGDLIPELLNLQKRICVNHVSKTTGLETVAALYTAYTYEFGRRGKNTLTLSTDKSGYVRVN